MNILIPSEGQILPYELPRDFETFYRARLRRVLGSRLRTREIMNAYLAWHQAGPRRPLSFIQLRSCMHAIGHAHRQSNGVYYLDVAFASDYPTIADTLPSPLMVAHPARQGLSKSSAAKLTDQVDLALKALLDLRRMLVAIEDDREPHIAAGRALGLFEG